MGNPVRVTLDQAAFEILVSGEVATVRGFTANGVVMVEISLCGGFRAIDTRVDRVTGEVIDLANLGRR